MPRVYRSPVKETSRKAPLESPHPHPPNKPLHFAAAEEARHTTAEEAVQAYTPPETEPDTPGDTHTSPDTDNLVLQQQK